MASRGAGRFLGILAFVHPPAALQSIAFGAAAHELPHAAGAGAGNGQGVESRFGLGQIDEFERDAFFAQDAADHVFVTPAASQSALQGAVTVVGEIVDEAGHLIGHDQRQSGAGGADFGFGFGFQVCVRGGVEVVGFVDGRGFRLLLGEAVALLQSGHFQAVGAFEDAIKFLLQAIVGAQVETAAQQLVEGGIKILFGGFEMTGAIVFLAGLIFLFHAGNQVAHGIDLQRLLHGWRGLSLGSDFGLLPGRIRWLASRRQRRSFGLGGRKERLLRALAAQHYGESRRGGGRFQEGPMQVG